MTEERKKVVEGKKVNSIRLAERKEGWGGGGEELLRPKPFVPEDTTYTHNTIILLFPLSLQSGLIQAETTLLLLAVGFLKTRRPCTP